jgi:hypothetical protein
MRNQMREIDGRGDPINKFGVALLQNRGALPYLSQFLPMLSFH